MNQKHSVRYVVCYSGNLQCRNLKRYSQACVLARRSSAGEVYQCGWLIVKVVVVLSAEWKKKRNLKWRLLIVYFDGLLVRLGFICGLFCVMRILLWSLGRQNFGTMEWTIYRTVGVTLIEINSEGCLQTLRAFSLCPNRPRIDDPWSIFAAF